MLVYEWSCHSLYFEGGVGPSSFSLVLGYLELVTDYPVGTLRFVSGFLWLGDAVRGKVEVPVAPVRPYRFPRDVRAGMGEHEAADLLERSTSAKGTILIRPSPKTRLLKTGAKSAELSGNMTPF